MTCREDQRRCDTPKRQRQFEISGSGEGGGDARDDLVADTGFAEGSHFLTSAAIDQGIPGFQPNHALAFGRERHEQLVDLTLRLSAAALALANRETLGVTAAHIDDRLRYQRVIDNRIGFHQHALGAQGQQVFGTRTGANEPHVARRLLGRIEQT
ncbi:hypothetical protein D9M72_499360 [compost metagenome]